MTTLDGQLADAAVVIAAGGAGVRMGPGAPKALRELAGESLLRRAVRGVLDADCVGCVAVAAPPGQETTVHNLLAPLGSRSARLPPPHHGRPATAPPGVAAAEIVVVTGGEQRQDSVAAALAAVPASFQIVLVHDAARALTPPSLVSEVTAAVRAGADAVIPVLPVADTIVQVGPTGVVVGNPDRADLRAVQTPQGFRRPVLESAHAAASGRPATDDASLVARLGVPVQTIPGSPYAMKITTGHDLAVAEALLAAVPPSRA